MTHAVVAEARRWIGTPYRHQASVHGAGCDCLGLVRGIWRALHSGQEPTIIPPYSQDWSEPQKDEVLWRAAKTWLQPVDLVGLQPGAVLLFRMHRRSIAKHLGILSNTGDQASFIHAYSGHGVVETALSPSWHSRLVAAFIFP